MNNKREIPAHRFLLAQTSHLVVLQTPSSVFDARAPGNKLNWFSEKTGEAMNKT